MRIEIAGGGAAVEETSDPPVDHKHPDGKRAMSEAWPPSQYRVALWAWRVLGDLVLNDQTVGLLTSSACGACKYAC